MGESEFHIWESDDGEFEAVFYHESNDPPGCALELSRRRDIEALQNDTNLARLMMDRGDAAIDAIIPVPNTTDALGVLKGEVDLTPSYKRLGECGEPELQMVRDFLANYAGILSWEAEAVRKHVEGLP